MNSEKEIKEMTKDELIEKLKADANAELYCDVDSIDENDIEVVEEDVKKHQEEQVLNDFSKFTRLIRRLKKAKTELQELEMFNKDNEELQRYIKLLNKVESLDKEIDDAKKGYLYESAILSPKTILDNDDVQITLTLPYDKEDFDTKQFKDDYGPETEMYQKYMKTKIVKGNIKCKIKD